jgi:hypothetical protein
MTVNLRATRVPMGSGSSVRMKAPVRLMLATYSATKSSTPWKSRLMTERGSRRSAAIAAGSGGLGHGAASLWTPWGPWPLASLPELRPWMSYCSWW